MTLCVVTFVLRDNHQCIVPSVRLFPSYEFLRSFNHSNSVLVTCIVTAFDAIQRSGWFGITSAQVSHDRCICEQSQCRARDVVLFTPVCCVLSSHQWH